MLVQEDGRLFAKQWRGVLKKSLGGGPIGVEIVERAKRWDQGPTGELRGIEQGGDLLPPQDHTLKVLGVRFYQAVESAHKAEGAEKDGHVQRALVTLENIEERWQELNAD